MFCPKVTLRLLKAFSKMDQKLCTDIFAKNTVKLLYIMLYSEWPLMAGGFAVNMMKMKDFPKFSISEEIYSFVADNFKNPLKFKPLVWKREQLLLPKNVH